MKRVMDYVAGVFEQGQGDGWERIVWSRHSTVELAARAARMYSRQDSPATGGSLTWAAWYGPIGGPYRTVEDRCERSAK